MQISLPARAWRRTTGELEVDARFVEIHADNLNAQPVTQPECRACAFADKPVLSGFEMKIVIAESGYMHEAINEDFVQLDENAESGHTGNDAVELFANALHHVFG